MKHTNLRGPWRSILLLVLYLGLGSQAFSEVILLPESLKKMNFINLYEVEAKVKLHPLSQWRLLEIEKKYMECLRRAPTLFNKHKKIQGWIITIWSQCLIKEFETKKDIKSLRAFLNLLERNQDLMDKGPWRSSLTTQVQKIFLAVIHFEEPKKVAKLLPQIKSIIYNRFSLWGPDLKKWAQLQTEQDLPQLAAKDKQVESTVFEDLIVINKKDKLTSLEPILKKQNIDSYKIDKENLLELLNQSYRKMEYEAIIDVADVLEKYFLFSQSYVQYLMMVGRSHHFTGNYEPALSYFQKVIESFPESEELQEALFRSGLVSLRQKDYPAAKKFFETLYSLKKDKYDITGRYWWLKALELTQDKRLQQEKKSFIFEYPYSYFGIKMQSESPDSKMDVFNENIKLPSTKWVLHGENEQSWFRFKELSERGWLLEAQSEIQSIPVPTNPVSLYYYSLLLSKAYQHPLAVRLMNQLLEATHDIRNLQMIKSIYPLTYYQKIKSESDKYKINPILIMSLIRQESSFGLRALSSSQAAGLMQMIQPTAMEVAAKLKLKIQFPEDLYRPEINIPMGTYYYSEVLRDFNFHVPLALASYNAGPHRIKTFINLREETKKLLIEKQMDWESELWIDELPWAETTGYVKSILRNALIYQRIQGQSLNYKPDFWRDFVLISQ